MGMFSWDCVACGFSIRDCGVCSEGNWMGKAVVLTPGGSRVIGEYDGYGRVAGMELGDQIDDFAMYHKACWELADKPEFEKPSRHARDQGFCLSHDDYTVPKPTSPEWFTIAAGWHSLHRMLSAICTMQYKLQAAEEEQVYASFDEETRARFDFKAGGVRWAGRAEDKVSFEFEGRTWGGFDAIIAMGAALRGQGIKDVRERLPYPERVGHVYVGDDGVKVEAWKLTNGQIEADVVIWEDSYPHDKVVERLGGFGDDDVAVTMALKAGQAAAAPFAATAERERVLEA